MFTLILIAIPAAAWTLYQASTVRRDEARFEAELRRAGK